MELSRQVLPLSREASETILGPLGECWTLIKEELKKILSPEAFETWIVPLVLDHFGNEEICLSAPSLDFYQKFMESYFSVVESCASSLGLDYLSITVELKKEASAPLELEDLYACHSFPQESSDSREDSSLPLVKDSNLNANYTFDSFVAGPSNQFALSSCQNVASHLGYSYNPLFIYGSTGLGKTHLLHAIGHQAKAKKPDTVIAYVSSERFMNEMIYCIRHNKMWDFREKYRHCDVFMMDDIQFMSGNKSTTQEEFFHTFNTLYDAKKQIVITSDLFPQDIPDIEERLRNRFQWGLIADIQPPDLNHRIEILFNKSKKLGVELSKEVAEYIAVQAKKSIRELEGALHRVAAFATLHGRPLDLILASEIFTSLGLEAQKKMKKVDLDFIQKIVAHHFEIRVNDLKSQKRSRQLTEPRQIAMYLTRQLTQDSYPEIGKGFGGRDHTTVMHAVKKISQEKGKNPDVKNHLEKIVREIELF